MDVSLQRGTMNAFDIFIVIVVGFCLIRGIFRGLIKELSSIIGVLAGFYGAYSYYMKISAVLSKWISNQGYLNILSFLIIFCCVFIIISILGVVIKYLLNVAFLGWIDRICGAGFGLMKGILIVSVVMVTLTAFLPKGSPIIKNSLLSPHVALVSEKMAKVVSKDMKHQFAGKIEELKKAWQKK
jgi:membrane protein required for colicin V production